MRRIDKKIKEFMDGLLAESGDGWGVFISDQYVEAAEIFERISKEQGTDYTKTIRNDGKMIVYSDGEESATFTDKESHQNGHLSGLLIYTDVVVVF